MYNPRSKSLPSGFVAQTFTSNNWTDANVDYLYSYFSCCYADLCYNYIKNLKIGSYTDKEKCQHASEVSFFSTGLNTLKYWHNPNTVGASASTTITTSVSYSSFTSIDVSIYLTPNLTWAANNLTSLPLIAQVTGQTSYANAFTALQAILTPLGFTLTVVSIGTHVQVISITAPLSYGGFTQYAVMQYVLTVSGSPETLNFYNQFSGGIDIFNPCISVSDLQCLVSKMESICGCFGCQSTAQITMDNNYVSIGQTFSSPPTPVVLPTNQLPN